MKVTLVDIQAPEALLEMLNTFEEPVYCCGIDLRHNQEMHDLICSMTAPGKGIPKLDLMISQNSDFSRILRYMRESGRTAA